MKTIHPMGLARLIARREPFDLIDVRTKKEFDKGHIPGARLIPLPELRRFDLLRRRPAVAESVYVICRSHALASLASGALEAAGHRNAVVVEGGMEVWEAEGLPVLRRTWFPKLTLDAPMVAVIAGLGLGLGLAVHEIFFLVPLALAGGALFMKFLSFIKAVDQTEPTAAENWVIPHLSRLVRLSENKVLFRPHHRVRFAIPH